jgi:hypothetical protein
MRKLAGPFCIFVLMTITLCAPSSAPAQDIGPCDTPNKLPASFFEVPEGPQGDWRATHLPDLRQGADPQVPVEVAGVGAIQGPVGRRGMRLGCGALRNRSDKSVSSVVLRWILINRQDRPEIIDKGYTSDTVLDHGHTGPITLAIMPDSIRRADFSVIDWRAVTQTLTREGKLRGDYFLCVGVQQATFEDGSVWNAPQLVP